MFAHDLIQFFNSNGVGDASSSFIDFTPSCPDNVFVVHETTGRSTPIVENSLYRDFQISYRSKSSQVAMNTCVKAYEAIRNNRSEAGLLLLPNNSFAQVIIHQSPFKYMVDENNRHCYGFNISITTNKF